jgi:integrase
MRGKITKSAVDKLKPGAILADSNPIGFVARKLPSGAITYGYRFRDPQSGKQRWIGLGVHGELTPDQARRKALRVAAEVKDGGKPASAAAAAAAAKRRQALGVNVDQLLDEFLTRYVRGEGKLRSADQIERAFNAYVRPRIGSKSIYDVTRLDVVELLDAVADTAGPVMADRTLAHLRKAFNWWATRDSEFSPPIVKGMARTKPKERERTRLLSDQEVRDIFRALETARVPKPFARLVRVLLLSCVRRDEAADASWQEMVEPGLWEIPASRMKAKRPHVVVMSPALRELFGEPKTKGFVFTTDGERPISGFSKSKKALDGEVGKIRKQEGREPMPNWRLNDLRRCGRSLLSRANVEADIGERVLAHVIGGSRSPYDRHEFLAQKKAALEKLAALVSRILKPGGRVVDFPKSA